MKKIVLLCAAGMSTNMLIKKMDAYAKEISFSCEIIARPIQDANEVIHDADLVLLGPQVKYEMDTIKKYATCPVEAMDMAAYGMMDGKRILDAALISLK